MNLIESSSYIKYLMVASDNWRKLYTVILRKYYVTMSLYKFVLRFLINTYEGRSFQKLFKAGSCDSPKYEVLDTYIWRNLTQVCNIFGKHTYAKTDNARFFILIRWNSNLKQQYKNVKWISLIGWTYLRFPRFEIYGRHLTYTM